MQAGTKSARACNSACDSKVGRHGTDKLHESASVFTPPPSCFPGVVNNACKGGAVARVGCSATCGRPARH